MTDEGKFGIILSNPQAYLPGSTVSGNVVINGEEEENRKGIKITFDGSVRCSWTEGRKQYTASEQIFEFGMDLLSEGGKTVVKLQRGWQAFPFSFQIPYDIPSSFEGTHGRVKYTLTATMKRSLKFNKTHKLTVYIRSFLDLNTYPMARIPIALEMQKQFCGFCVGASGSINILFQVSKSGFVSGERVPFTLKIDNQSSTTLSKCNIFIVQVGMYQTESNEKVNKSKVLLGVTDPVPSEKQLNISSIIKMPSSPTLLETNLSSRAERIIQLNYYFEVELQFPFWAKDFKRKVPIIIGTVPLKTSSYPEPSSEREEPNIKRLNNSPEVTEESELADVDITNYHVNQCSLSPSQFSLVSQDQDNVRFSSGISSPAMYMNIEDFPPSYDDEVSLKF